MAVALIVKENLGESIEKKNVSVVGQFIAHNVSESGHTQFNRRNWLGVQFMSSRHKYESRES